jgi:predicted nuclease with TOPRIM domain
MWVPAKVVDWFHISKQTVESQREELAAVRAERDSLRLQLAASQNHFDWLRIRVNSLEIERAQLIEKAYGIKIPVPEIAHTIAPTQDMANQFSFDDMGDDMAKKLGLPLYNS